MNPMSGRSVGWAHCQMRGSSARVVMLLNYIDEAKGSGILRSSYPSSSMHVSLTTLALVSLASGLSPLAAI
jgi:hypothetical protein